MNDDLMEATGYEVSTEGGSEGVYLLSEEVPVLDYQETLSVADRGFYTTPFSEYTVTEGLLLLVFIFVVIDFFFNLVRRWF